MKVNPSLLFSLGFTALILQLPGGVFHLYLGRLAYLKDVIALAAFIGGALYLTQTWASIRKPTYTVAFFALLLFPVAPLLLGPERLNALLLVKWVILWAVAYAIGLTFSRVPKSYKVLAASVLVAYFAVEALIGLWEIRNQRFFLILAHTDITDAGVELAKMNTLEDMIRVKGLQRNVFQFANLMALIFALSVAVIALARISVFSLFAIGAALVSVYCVTKSGGRTALVGCAFVVVAIPLLLIKSLREREGVVAIMLMFFPLAGVIVSLLGPAKLAESVFSFLNYEGAIANLESTLMRQQVWAGAMQTLVSSPLKLFFGTMIVGSGSHQQAINILDNQYLWFLYHYGFFGATAIAVLFFRVVFAATAGDRTASIGSIIIILSAVSAGEAIGRDVAFYFSTLALFIAVGAGSCSHPLTQGVHFNRRLTRGLGTPRHSAS